MSRIAFLFFISIVIISCKKEYQPRTLDKIAIKAFKMDSTSIRAIKAIDKNTLYFAGSRGDVGYTKDGGKSWTIEYLRYQDTLIPHFRSIAFNGSDIFVLSIANPALLYKIAADKNKLVYVENNNKVFYDAMRFFSDKIHGIAVGDPITNCPSVIVTDNGGDSWTKISCDNLPKFEQEEAFFAASNTNIKIIDNIIWIASGGKKARVLKSVDKGKTWQVYNTPIVQGNGPQGIYSIDFYDKNNGIIIGGNYANPEANIANKAITTDGGKTWQLVANGQNPAYKSCVQYVPNTNGKEIFAVGKTGIDFSNDGGITWKKVSNESYYSIQFVNATTAWLSGNNKIGKLVF
ncbi:oxidoreductase [Tenacibaculum sp. UWU-22]|uniref:sialidase family protein n=1 Tax=Tenacibaculum sp. UWU-22 TaxID=3234187 RepID=UPI0034DB4085